jgi:hypothetical protein
MKKLFDPEEYDRHVIQDHIRFLRAKKQVEDFKKQQMRTLDHLDSNNSTDNKRFLTQDPKYLRNGFSTLFQPQLIPEQDKEYIVEKIIRRDQANNCLTKRKRDQFEDLPSLPQDASQMDIDEEDQQLYNEFNVNNEENKHIDEFMPNKRRKLAKNDMDDVNTTITVDNTHNNHPNDNEHSGIDSNQKKRKATEMEIENEVETKRRRID